MTIVKASSAQRLDDRAAVAASWRIGPAFVAAVAYVDPGNVVTNVAAGASHGTTLLWVVVLATLVAGPVQYLAAKLGATTGKSLPELIADRCSRPVRLAYWPQAEAVSIATDLAEVLGAAIALHLLFGIPLPLGGLLAAVAGAVLLAAGDRFGPCFLRNVAVVSLALIAGAFIFCLLARPPGLDELGAGLIPSLEGDGVLVLAAGIVGATIMPHAVHIHSALARDHRRLSAHRTDVALAMLVAGTTNAVMLLVGAGALQGSTSGGFGAIATDVAARIGSAAQLAFLVALLVSGVTSTVVGTQAGAVVTSGLLRRSVPLWARRCTTVLPAVVLLALGVSPVTLLITSQVVLAIGLPLVLVPLVAATSSPRVMGTAANTRPLAITMVAATTAVICLDVSLLVQFVQGCLQAG
ncbi:MULTISPECIES: Nramp family divalent metal transporter [Streptomyces]|uniref:Nramp family divalent metal transporter n=1 Tax=Streptomyces lonegramiae TaxID=3075524 RepID=A0ABU2X5Y8_9ACTN|nr:Nramp family divalent metal transporter [Streptomyces sp. DSM 41529]MDT0541327.1 Nramp family divalent metal transporter [Streptomyces sp. DSM 41529]